MATKFKGDEEQRLTLDTFIKLSRCADAVQAQTQSHLRRWNLTVSQFGVLEALHHLGPMHQKDIARKILRSTGNMTLVINNLEKRGLIRRERNADDKRYITVHLTGDGQELISKVFPEHLEGIMGAMSYLAEEEKSALGDLCKKLGKSVGG